MRVNFAKYTTVQSVAARLGLPWERGMQDWEIQVADEHRIEEFSYALSVASEREEKICLLDLVLASLDEWTIAREPIQQSQIVDVSRRVGALVGPALQEFPDVVEYWLKADFPVAKIVRAILADMDVHSR